MTATLDVLILDDQPEDAELMAAELRRAGFDLAWEWVDTEEAYLSRLNREVDVILADYSMPGFGAMRALELLHESEWDIPFIVVTGNLPDDVAVGTVAVGADDYLLKDRLARLGPTVERVLQERKAREEKRAVETALLVSETRASELAELSRVISSTGDITEVFPLFADHVKKLIPFDRIGIMVIDWRREVLTDAYVSGLVIESIEAGHEIPLDEYALRGAFERGESRVLSERDLVALAGRYQHVVAGLAAGLKSAIVIPMRSGNQTVGLFILRSFADDAYGDQDLVLAEHVAAQIAGAVANDQLRKTAEEEARRHAVLAEIGRIVSSESSLDGIYPKFAKVLRKLVRADRIVIRLVNADGMSFTRHFADGVGGPYGEIGAAIPLTGTITGEIIRTRKSFLIDSQHRMALARQFPVLERAFAKGLISGVSVPMISSDQLIGVLGLTASVEDAYGPREVELIEEVAAQIAGAVANDQLRQVAEAEARQHAVLAEIGRIVSSESSLDGIYPKFAKVLRKLVRADRIVIRLVNADGMSFTRHFSDGVGGPYGEIGAAIPLTGTITGEVVRTRKSFLIGSQHRMALAQRFPALEQAIAMGLISGVLVPLISSDQLIGVLGVIAREEDAYGLRDVELIEEVAAQIAGAIANAQLHDSTRREADERSVLAEIGRIVSSSPDIDDVYELFTECVRRLIPCDRLVISLAAPDGPSIWSGVYPSGRDLPYPAGAPYPRAENAASLFDTDHTPVVVDQEFLAETPFGEKPDRAARSAGMQSLMIAPLIWDDQVIGTLSFRSEFPDAYTTDELAIADRVARQIAGAIVNSGLHAKVRWESERRQALAEIGRVITSSTDIREVFEQFAILTNQLVPFDRLVIAMYDTESDALTDRYVTGMKVLDWPEGHTHKLIGNPLEAVVRKQIPFIATGLDESEFSGHPARKASLKTGLPSMLAVPLVSRGEVIGTLNLKSRTPGAYADADVALVRQVANQIAGAVANAQLHEQTRKEADERSILAEIGMIVSSAPDIDDVYERFAKCVRQIIPFDRLVIALNALDDPNAWMDVYVSGREIPGFRANARYARDLSAAALFDTNRRPIIVDQEILADMPAWKKNDRLARSVGLQSMMIAQLIWDDQLIGTLNFRSALPDAYGTNELGTAGRVADQIAGAIANARARQWVEEAHEQLATSENNYRDLVETSFDLIWRCDAEGRFTYLNPAWERATGYTVDEMLGQHFTDFLSPEIVERNRREFDRHLAGDSVFDYESRHIAKSGEEITLLFNAFPVTDADGEVVAVRGTARDITEERRAQKSLATSETNYRDLVETAHELVWRSDAKGLFAYLNPSWERVLGYTVDEMLGRHFSDFQLPESAARDRREFVDRIASGSVIDYETRCVAKSGEEITLLFNATLVTNADGEITSTKGTARDITAGKKAVEELRIRLAALDAAADMVVITDSQGTIEYVNGAFTEETGYERDEVIGGNLRILKSGRQDPEFYRDLWDTITTGEVWSGTLINRRKNGSEYQEEMSITPVAGDHGEVLRFIAIKRDITDRLEIETLIGQSLAKQELISTVEHELRSPLAAIINFVDLLRLSAVRRPDVIEALKSSTSELASIVNDLRSVSSKATAQLKIDRKPENISLLLSNTITRSTVLVERKNLNIHVTIDKDPAVVELEVDASRITQLFSNLITNAVRYSPEESNIEIELGRSGGFTSFRIYNDGAGVTGSELEMVTHPYFRGTSSHTSPELGSGIGLALSAAIVKSHGGYMNIRSEPDEFFEVEVLLPNLNLN